MTDGQTILTDDSTVVREFIDLLENSKQLFNGLRDLPQHGQRQWQPHFAKTFETYTKLWKFQQENRITLDHVYNLKRWEIGEIASKIGQLYYHYYLRTSETNYLKEAYQFYSAIRARNYYKSIGKEENPDLLLKKHRYFARFIVVCLLLNYKQDVYDLVEIFSREVDEYRSLNNNKEDDEWKMVVMEIKDFPHSDPVQVLNSENYQRCDITMRLLPDSLPAMDIDLEKNMALGDALIVGNSPSQMKFSELTIDMFRMVQVLERAPAFRNSSRAQRRRRVDPFQEASDKILKRENPHKYLIYRPTFFQLNTFLSTAVKELPANHVLLVYLSAHGSVSKYLRKTEANEGYDGGGIITNDRRDEHPAKGVKTFHHVHCFHPGDIYPYLRKPMLLIVDSDNAHAFASIPNLFGQPFVCLMAPNQVPLSVKDRFKQGRLLTNFLYSPLLSFMLICGIAQTNDVLYNACSEVMQRAFLEIQKAFLRSRSIDRSFCQFMGDDFLRLILLRFVFCSCAMRQHKMYKDAKYHPKCHPALPEDEFSNNPAVGKAISDMAMILGARSMFLDYLP